MPIAYGRDRKNGPYLEDGADARLTVDTVFFRREVETAMEREAGIEPAACDLGNRCSAY